MRLARLFPQLAGLHIAEVQVTGEDITIMAVATRTTATCPLCRHRSSRVHSRYRRRVADLPVSGRAVHVLLHVRRFVCARRSCARRIFTERVPTLVTPWGRRSLGLCDALEHIGFALGEEAGARLAPQLGLPTTPTALLHLVRAAPSPAVGCPRIIGIDDYARRRGRTYGTLICDHEQGRVLDLLPDRSADTVAAWLARYPSIQIITRDRGNAYIEGATRGAPQAVQVADRWHLLHNAGEAVERLLLREQRVWRHAAAPRTPAAAATPAPTAVPVRSSRAQQEQAARLAVRTARFTEVRRLAQHGHSVRAIAAQTHLSRDTVSAYLHADAPPAIQQRARRPHVIDRYAPYLQRRWQDGCHSATVLFTELRAHGYTGSYVSCATYVRTLRHTVQQAHPLPLTTPEALGSPRQAVWLFVARPTDLAEKDAALLTRLCQASSTLATAYTMIQSFAVMVRERRGDGLESWLVAAEASGIAALRSFAEGLRKDKAAVQAGLTLPYSQGRTEGSVTRLTLLKRAMFGRAKHDLLRQRVVGRG